MQLQKSKFASILLLKNQKDNLVKEKNNQEASAIRDVHLTALAAFGGKNKLVHNWKYEKALKKLFLQWY